MLGEWLQRPYIAAWWGACRTFEVVHANYLPGTASPSAATPYWAYRDAGIDQFLAEGHCLGQGLGTAMVRVQFLLCDSAVTRIQADPAPANARAMRCHEKAGFHSRSHHHTGRLRPARGPRPAGSRSAGLSLLPFAVFADSGDVHFYISLAEASLLASDGCIRTAFQGGFVLHLKLMKRENNHSAKGW